MVVVPDSASPTENQMAGHAITNGLGNTREINDNGSNSLANGEMSQLDQLLEQVKNLKLENSTLKNELSNNTSQINRLESEALDLKKMVLQLGNSISSQPALDHTEPEPRPHIFAPASRMVPSHSTLSPYQEYGLPSHASFTNAMFETQLPTTPNHNDSVNYISPVDVRQRLHWLTTQRDSLLEKLKREECAKDDYMKQLNDLNKSLLASEKTMSPNSETNRKQLERSIYNVQDAMKQKLGTPEMMNKRVQNWLQHLKSVEQEIQSIKARYAYNNRTTKSMHDQKTLQSEQQDFGFCERSKPHQSGRGLTDVVVQTGKVGPLEVLPEKFLSPIQPLLGNTGSGEQVATRCTQTIYTSASVSTRGFHLQERSGSVTSLPDNISGGQLPENSRLPPKQNLIVRDLEIIKKYCQALQQYLHCHAECVKSSTKKATPPGGKDVQKLRSLQADVQITENLIRSVEQVRQFSYDKYDRVVLNRHNGINCMAELLILNCRICKETKVVQSQESSCIIKPTGFTLTNLSFGDQHNKALLINMNGFLEAVIEQLMSRSEEIQQVMAGILRNLSWQADSHSRDLLRQKGAVGALMQSVMAAKREETLKSMLGALWNVSGHCPENRLDICVIEGALSFLVSTLTYRSPSKRPEVVECGGGVLRNVSSVIATNEEYRKVLRKHHCLQQLLQLLTSPSLTIVSNACCTLWNLSARDSTDQQILRDMGAIGKLRKLTQSRHEVIAQGSAAALRNLVQNQPEKAMASLALNSEGQKNCDAPCLQARKLKQMEAELKTVTSSSHSYSELSDNFSPRHLPRQTGFPPRWPVQAWAPSSDKARFPTGYGAKLGGNTFPQSADARSIRVMPSYPTFPSDLHSGAMEQHYARMQSTSLPRQTGGHTPSGIKPMRTWGQAGQGHPQMGADVGNKTGGENHGVLSPPKMPDHLEEKLRHLDEELDDEGPVNYSVMFTDDMSRTPAIQSPRTTEMFENRANFHPVSSGIQTMPALSSATISQTNSITTNRANAAVSRVPNTSSNIQPAATVSRTVNSTELYANDDRFEPEETPKDFGALYVEDELYQHATDSYEQRMYVPPLNRNSELESVGEERFKEFNVEDTPLCFSHQSSLSNLNCEDDEATGGKEQAAQPEVHVSLQKQEDIDYDPNEDVDKFDSGAMTPAQYVFTSRTPHYQETPLIFSRNSPVSDLTDVGTPSSHSDIQSDVDSVMPSGIASPSELPDSPGHSMPVSRQRSVTNIYEAANRTGADGCHAKPVTQPDLPVVATSNTAPMPAKQGPLGVNCIGYRIILPPSDEIKRFSEEPAMSEMTTFSGLTVDDDKVAPLGNVKTLPMTAEAAESDESKKELDQSFDKLDTRAIKQAGYTTSLPTNDEIKHFTNEGTLSPMVTLSVISDLRSHNDGFQRGARSPNRNSFTSRSSATGASIPNAPVPANNLDKGPSAREGSYSGSKSSISDPTSPEQAESKDFPEPDEFGDTSSLDDSFSEDEEADRMLQQCIEQGKPTKKKSHSTKSTRSTKGKDKDKTTVKKSTTPKPQPATKPQPAPKPSLPVAKPMRKFDVRQSLAAADNKLNGIGIVQYIDSKMGEDDRSSLPEMRNQIPGDSNISPDVENRRAPTGREVIQTVETLNETYSVKKHLRANEKQVPNEEETQLPTSTNQAKVQAFLHPMGPTRYAIEGTPVDMSRCTSLSNLTMDSGPDSCDFGALQRKMAENRRSPPQDASIQEKAPSPTDKVNKVENTDKPSTGNDLNKEHGDVENPVTSQEPNPVGDESKVILEDLDKQIQNLTVDTATSRAGYMTSLPVGDEIKKFQVEGSVGAFTNFSALTVDSDTKIAPCAPDTQGQLAADVQAKQRPHDVATAKLDVYEEAFEEAAEEAGVEEMPDPAQHYGEDRNATRDRPLSFKIEDTPYCLSGNSSLSSIDIDSDGDDNLLKDCISSAMPVARRDPAAAIPPNQLALYQQQNVSDFALPSNRRPLQANSSQANAWDHIHAQDNQAATSNANSNLPISAISPLSLVSLSPADDPSAAFTVSSAGNTLTGDSYYRLSRQPSLSESANSEGSMSLGGDAASLMKSQKPATGRPKIVKKKSVDASSDGRHNPVVKGGKKIYRSPITGKPRENLRPTKDNVSTGSSSTPGRESHSRNRSNKSPCNKCHPPRSRQIPQSSSLGKLADSSPGRQRRKTAASTHSKPMVRDYDPQMIRKPVRSRSAHSGCHSSVTQLYPAIDRINSVMWNGVASLAARGDLVVTQHDGQFAQVVPVSIGGSGPRPVLLKQGTFIQDEPSPVLVQSVAQGKKVKKGDPHVKQGKKSSEAGSKGANVWRGLKKLLSPGDEPKNAPHSPSRKPKNASKIPPSSSGRASKDSSDTQSFDSNTWTKNKKRDPNAPVISKEPIKSKSADALRQAPVSNLVLTSSSQTSSLSLSSSASSNASAGPSNEDHFKSAAPRKSIYPTERTLRPAHHIPKSPSPRNRIIVGKSPPTKPRAATNSWRRTPTPENAAKRTQGRKISVESSSSTTSASMECRRSTAHSSKSRLGSQTSVSSKSPRNVASPGQISNARALNEEAENSTRVSLDDANLLFSPRRRVVQEVAPFNYRPNPKSSENIRSEDYQKHDPNRKQTTV